MEKIKIIIKKINNQTFKMLNTFLRFSLNLEGWFSGMSESLLGPTENPHFLTSFPCDLNQAS